LAIKVIYRMDHLSEREDHIGKDLTDSTNYFGSADSRLIEAEFTHAAKLYASPSSRLSSPR